MKTQITGKQRGNTIAEYSLIGTGVLLATIAMVLLIGQNLDTALRGLPGDMRRSISGAQAFSNLVASQKSASTTSQTSKTTSSSSSQDYICTNTRSGRICVKVPENYIRNSGLTSTTGSIGDKLTAEQFSKIFLAASSEVNPRETKRILNRLLVELAQAGQEIGQAETELSFICRAGRACDYGIRTTPKTELEEMAFNKVEEIQEISSEFQNTKVVLDAMLAVSSTLPPSDKELIDDRSELIIDIAESKDVSDIADIKSGAAAQTVISSSNDICSTSTDPLQCTQ